MSEINVKQDPSIDVASAFAAVKNNSAAEEIIVPTQKTPLQQMKEQQSSGMVIQNFDSEGPKKGGPINDQRFEDANQYLSEMDSLIEKAKSVSIVEKPKSDIEMAALIDELENLDPAEVERQQKVREAINQGRDMNVVKENDLVGAEINAGTQVAGENGIGSDKFVPRGSVMPAPSKDLGAVDEGTTSEAAPETKNVQVIINKTETPGESRSIDFTEEERTKLRESTTIDLISVKKVNINTSKVVRPVDTFMDDYKTHIHKAIGGSVPMTFTGSRFRGTFRGLAIGEYLDLALSTEIGNVEKLNKRLSTIYGAITSTSIGQFSSYDDFLKNFAYVDIPLGVYSLYISTNPETLEIDLRCGGEDCKKPFKVSFSPRSLLRTERLSDYYLANMEKTASVEGAEAVKWHEESSLMTRTVIELPQSEIAIEMGLRSCYENIHYILPFAAELEEKFTEKYPDDVNKVLQILAYISKYVSAVYFKDESGEYTTRVDDISQLIEIIWHLPMNDYAILDAMVNQTEDDYMISFGILDVECPECKRKTEFVAIDLDGEVFQRVQEQGNTVVNRETLPRL